MWKRSGSKCVSCFLLELEKTPQKFNIDTLKMAHIWGRRYMNSIRPIILGPKMPLVFMGACFSLMQQRLLHQHRGWPRSSKSQGNGGTKSWQTNRGGTAMVTKNGVKSEQRSCHQTPRNKQFALFNRNKINQTISPLNANKNKKKHQIIHGLTHMKGFRSSKIQEFGCTDTRPRSAPCLQQLGASDYPWDFQDPVGSCRTRHPGHSAWCCHSRKGHSQKMDHLCLKLEAMKKTGTAQA